jgi:hypothetical protein
VRAGRRSGGVSSVTGPRGLPTGVFKPRGLGRVKRTEQDDQLAGASDLPAVAHVGQIQAGFSGI